MICSNCKKEIQPGTRYCLYCGTAVETTEYGGNQNSRKASLEEDVVAFREEYPPMRDKEPVMIERHSYEKPVKRQSNTGLIIAVIISVISISIAVVLLLVNLVGTKTGGGSNEVSLSVTNTYPTTTGDLSYCLTGNVSTTDSELTLKINGQIITVFSAHTENGCWAKELWFKNGVNTFDITLSDAGGAEIARETISINYEPQLMFPKGTVLVKNDTSGVYVRKTPAVSKEFQLLIQHYDYTTTLICQGTEYRDGDGYIWAQVTIPNGKTGWVRTDLVRAR